MDKTIQLTKSEKIRLSTTEIAKLVRTQLKKEFLNTKFSVTSEYYSGGSSLTVSLMKTDIKIVKAASELTELQFMTYADEQGRTREQLKDMQSLRYCQLNQYTLRDDYNPDNWCNGTFLTKEGFELLKRMVKIVDQYNFDESDSQTDYYCVNFSFHPQIGKWDKPVVQKGDSQ